VTLNETDVGLAPDVQGAADAVLAEQLGVRRAYVFVTDPNDAYAAGLGAAFVRAGRTLGIRVEESSPRSRDCFASLAEDLRGRRVDGAAASSPSRYDSSRARAAASRKRSAQRSGAGT
jgi:ABC-type sugar transport system substrate-binding protein